MANRTTTNAAERREALESIRNALAIFAPVLKSTVLYERIGNRVGEPLRGTQYGVLARIGFAAPIRISDLSHDLGLEVSTLSRHVAGLVKAGLVEREPDPRDGRSFSLSLTEAGEARFQSLHGAWIDLLDELLSDWGRDAIVPFAEALATFADRLLAQSRQAEEENE